MISKKMTKEEALEFLKNKKILCKNEKESLEVQNKFLELRKKLLNLDCIWRTTTKMYYLFFIDNISVFTPIDNYNVWVEDPREELKVQELLSIQIKEEQKPKFNPNTLQPFDKVLVRDDDTCKWGISFFDIYEYELGHFCCIEDTYYQCVPYNEETKHLHRTNNEAPEYYQIWKK
jgi:hypothetical protein